MSVVSEVRRGGDGEEKKARLQTPSRVCRFPLVALCGCDGSPVVARTAAERRRATHVRGTAIRKAEGRDVAKTPG